MGKPLPDAVIGPLLQLLGWAAWLGLLVGVTRIIFAGALLMIRAHRDEAIEGVIAALLGGVVLATASGFAAAILAPP